jgi:hypothetical protein
MAQALPPAWATWEAPPLVSGAESGAAVSAGRGSVVVFPWLVVGGLTGGMAGFFGGGYLGYLLSGGDRGCGEEDCGLLGVVYGAAAGESILLPLGVHLANHRRGSYAYSLLASVAVGALGIGLAGATDSAELLLAVPIGQLVSSVLIERATSRRKKITR